MFGLVASARLAESTILPRAPMQTSVLGRRRIEVDGGCKKLGSGSALRSSRRRERIVSGLFLKRALPEGANRNSNT